jgi:alpha-D-ribose 1-methylphosphonate 5-triphosphate diphosphatase
MTNLHVVNAHLAAPGGVVNADVWIRDGLIAGIAPEVGPGGCQRIDFEGDWLLPGLVEMHTDTLEKHLSPRPGVVWPEPLGAVLAHDAQLVAAGITTVFDAVSVGVFDERSPRRALFDLSLDALALARERGLLRADHHLHLRCESPDPAVLEMFESRMGEKALGLVSLMDHTPGQRQWVDIEKYRIYHRDKQWTGEELAANVAMRRDMQKRNSRKHRTRILEKCKTLGVVLASHDDTLPEHAEETHRDGMRISEFPTTLAAAARARELGLAVVMGAPNVVRGESHSGNVSAMELAEKGLLDGLSSDYMPASLLHAAFILRDALGLSLHRAIAMVSGNIARAVGLNDRGDIATGKRADLLRVREVAGVPVVVGVWRQGARLL